MAGGSALKSERILTPVSTMSNHVYTERVIDDECVNERKSVHEFEEDAKWIEQGMETVRTEGK